MEPEYLLWVGLACQGRASEFLQTFKRMLDDTPKWCIDPR
jgi:hypothetical protein